MCEEFPDLHSNSEAVITLPQLHNMLGYTPLGFVVEDRNVRRYDVNSYGTYTCDVGWLDFILNMVYV